MAPPLTILAVDLDGTLIGPAGRVSAANVDALARLRDAGVLVLPCTGRGWVECASVLAQIGHSGPAVVAGGAMVCDGATGATLARFGVSSAITRQAVGTIHDAGHAALVLKDRAEAGHDYLVVTGSDDHPVDPVSVWWFEEHDLTTRFVRSLEDDAHPEATVRVGLVADAHRSVPLMHKMMAELGPEVLLHSFPALVSLDGVPGEYATREVHVLEVFDRRAHKWGAIEWVAREHRRSGRIAAIGDHVNDVSMLRAADLGIAMGNAAPPAREAADIVTRHCHDDGVAYAVEQILSGAW